MFVSVVETSVFVTARKGSSGWNLTLGAPSDGGDDLVRTGLLQPEQEVSVAAETIIDGALFTATHQTATQSERGKDATNDLDALRDAPHLHGGPTP
jgi:hypothetical protein